MQKIRTKILKAGAIGIAAVGIATACSAVLIVAAADKAIRTVQNAKSASK